jgi:hypothetical protein
MAATPGLPSCCNSISLSPAAKTLTASLWRTCRGTSGSQEMASAHPANVIIGLAAALTVIFLLRTDLALHGTPPAR